MALILSKRIVFEDSFRLMSNQRLSNAQNSLQSYREQVGSFLDLESHVLLIRFSQNICAGIFFGSSFLIGRIAHLHDLKIVITVFLEVIATYCELRCIRGLRVRVWLAELRFWAGTAPILLRGYGHVVIILSLLRYFLYHSVSYRSVRFSSFLFFLMDIRVC